MSINVHNSLESQEDAVSVNFDEIPSLLGLHSFSSEHILHPEKIDFFASILADLNAKCESFSGEFMLDSRDYERYYAMMLEFLRPYLQEIYEEHQAELARMIMHIPAEMIQDKRKFLPFFILQMFLLQKDLKRNEPISKKILAAKHPDDIDIDEIHYHLKRDAQGSLFIDSNYTCIFDIPHPDNSLPSKFRGGKLRYTRRFYSWPTENMIGYGVPEFREAIKTQSRLDEHIDNTLCAQDKTFAAAFYHIGKMDPDDPPESMIYMGDHMAFDNRSPDKKEYPKLIVVMKRDTGQRELDAFKSLLAARKLACYPSIIRLFTRPQYHYLWRLVIQENPDLCKKIRSHPLSKPGIFFRKIFDAKSIDMMTGIDKPLENKTREKLSLFNEEPWGWTLPPRGEIEVLERKRGELNRRITSILNGHTQVRKPDREVQALKQEVLQIHRRIVKLTCTALNEVRFLSAMDIHRMRRIELDALLIGFSPYNTAQPEYIDCSLLLEAGLPTNVQLSVSRKLPGEKESVFIHSVLDMPADGRILLPEATLKHDGKIVYQVTFIAPEGREFEINTTIKTIILETASLRKPSELLVSVPKPPELSQEEKERASLEAALTLLSTYRDAYRARGMYADGVVTLRLDESHISSHSKILPKHRQWSADDDGAITPEIENGQDVILSLAEEIRVRVRQENEEKEEKNKETQSLSTALMVLSDHQEFYEQEGEYTEGVVTIRLEDEHIQSVLQILGEEGVEVRPHHRSWTITDTGIISGVLEPEAQDMMIALAEKIRARVKQEQDDAKEMAAKKVIQDIDAEFTALGFSLSEALDTADLKLALNQKIDTFKQKRKNGEAEWNAEMERLSSTCKTAGYRFFTARYENGFPTAVTLSKVNGWSAVLTLQPVVSFRLNNPPQKDGQIIRQRIENVLLTFVYNIMKNGDGTLFALDQDTRAKEDLVKLKRDYKRDLRNKKARIIVQKIDGTFLIIRNVSRDNLEAELRQAQSTHGSGNVALLLRESTYHFHGEHGVIKPRVDKIRDAYDSFSDSDVGVERREILRQRIIKTLVDQNMLKNITVNGCKRDGFIPGSGVDQILTGAVKSFIEKKQSELAEGDIDDAFLNAFIDKLKSGDSPVPVSYVNHRVAYCRPDDVASLIVD